MKNSENWMLVAVDEPGKTPTQEHPMTPEDIAHTATHLHTLYKELDQAKYENNTIRTERKQTPTFAPRTPAPIWTISDDHHFTSHLTELVQDAARYTTTKPQSLTNGQLMCQWIEAESTTIATLDVAPHLHWELQQQIKELDHKLQRTRPPQPITIAEHRQTAHSICHRLQQMGHRITPELLRQWAKRGKITTIELDGGKNGYLLSEVLDAI